MTLNPVTDEAEYVSADFVRVKTFEDAVVLELPPPQADNISANGVVPITANFLLLDNFSEISPTIVAFPAVKAKALDLLI